MAIKILLIAIAIILIVLLTGKIIVNKLFNKKVAELFAQSTNITDKKFRYNQLNGLPDPVQRYFKHVLKEGQPYISCARLTHGGQFKNSLKKDWMDIEGVEYFSIDHPGFAWKGKTSFFSAIDSYVAGKGRLVAFLFNIIKVADGQGEKYNEGELLRWLGESVCFPTNLLPKENLQWLPINDSSAQLNFQYNGISIHYTVMFNDKNEITQLETERFMDDTKLEKWINKLSDYKKINEVMIPTMLEAGWQLNDVYFPYAKFNIQKIDFNKPEML